MPSTTKPVTTAHDISEEELWSALGSQPDSNAKERLFEIHVNYAKSLALLHFRRSGIEGIELTDLLQAAYTGLLEAIDRYDQSKGVKFRSFGKKRISGAISDAVAKYSEAREQRTALNSMRAERIRSINEENTGAMSASEALESLNDLAIGLALGFMLEGTGLYSDENAAANIAYNHAYDSADWKQLMGRLIAEVGALPDREQQILRHHYQDEMTFDNLAKLFGITKGRVSQLHRAALRLLRKRLSAKGHFTVER